MKTHICKACGEPVGPEDITSIPTALGMEDVCKCGAVEQFRQIAPTAEEYRRYAQDLREWATCHVGQREISSQACKRMHLVADLMDGLVLQVAATEKERDKLAAFKSYVHKRLDDAGVPSDPESPHKSEGCRIGGRLDIVLLNELPDVPEPYPQVVIGDDDVIAHHFDHVSVLTKNNREMIVHGEGTDWLAGDAVATQRSEGGKYEKRWYAHRSDAIEYAGRLLAYDGPAKAVPAEFGDKKPMPTLAELNAVLTKAYSLSEDGHRPEASNLIDQAMGMVNLMEEAVA